MKLTLLPWQALIDGVYVEATAATMHELRAHRALSLVEESLTDKAGRLTATQTAFSRAVSTYMAHVPDTDPAAIGRIAFASLASAAPPTQPTPQLWAPAAQAPPEEQHAPIGERHEAARMPKLLTQWTDEEIETARQTGLAAARVFRLMEESHRVSRVLDALLPSAGLPTRRAEREPATTAPAPGGAASATHKTKRRADPLAAVLTEAKRQALDASDWQSVWAALVKLAQKATRPAPLLGYVEGEGVKYQSDKSDAPDAYLSREAFRGRFRRNG